MVGMEERIRVSSVIFLPSRGTFTSHRTRTFLPLRSDSLRSSMDFLASRAKSKEAGAVKVRTPKAGVVGAKAEAAGMAKRARALENFMVDKRLKEERTKLQIVSGGVGARKASN